MNFYPPFQITFLNGFLLTLLMMVLRFGIPAMMKKEALAELNYFPPVQGRERLALKIYFFSNTFLVFSPLLAEINPLESIKRIAWGIYIGGAILLAKSLIDYCRQKDLKTRGIYSYSRNPLCLGYFFIFLGTSLLISSWFHLALTVVYQTAVHGLILSEERWCLENFNEDYQYYFSNTPRYFII